MWSCNNCNGCGQRWKSVETLHQSGNGVKSALRVVAMLSLEQLVIVKLYCHAKQKKYVIYKLKLVVKLIYVIF